jgi:hypothetical protein
MEREEYEELKFALKQLQDRGTIVRFDVPQKYRQMMQKKSSEE